MRASHLRSLFALLALAILVSAGLLFMRPGAHTREQMESRLLELLDEQVSVPLTNTEVSPVVDIQTVLDVNGDWYVQVNTPGFRLVNESNDEKLTNGYIVLYVDGKRLGELEMRQYRLGKLSGRHVIAAVLVNPERELYRHKEKTVSKVIDGIFSDKSFTPVTR